jgi:MoxR-like ATPase
VAAQVLEADTVLRLQEAADEVFASHAVVDYAVRLVTTTRDPQGGGVPEIGPALAHGASPRASLGLVAAGRALALLRGRTYVLPDDVADLAPEVLRHRLVLSYEALADGITADQVVSRLLERIPVPQISPSQAAGTR